MHALRIPCLLIIGAGIALPALAGPPPAGARPAVAASTAHAAPAVIKPGSRLCLRDTGSHIRARGGQCLPAANGRSYGAKDLQRTGQVDPVAALRMLDPAVR